MAEQQTAIAISPDGKTIATIAAARLTLHAGDGRTPARQYVPPRNGAAKRYGSVCWAPDASLVACGAADGSVTVWDVRKGVIRTTLPGSDPVKTVRFAADGAALWVSTTTPDGAPRRTVRRLALDGATNEIDADARGVSTLAPHPSSGDACAVASSRVRLVKGTERRTLPGAHATFVRCLAWTKDGRRVASSADAREILVHDCVSNSSETLRCAAPLISLACFVRSDVVVCAAVLADGRVQLARRRARSAHRRRPMCPRASLENGRPLAWVPACRKPPLHDKRAAANPVCRREAEMSNATTLPIPRSSAPLSPLQQASSATSSRTSLPPQSPRSAGAAGVYVKRE